MPYDIIRPHWVKIFSWDLIIMSVPGLAAGVPHPQRVATDAWVCSIPAGPHPGWSGGCSVRDTVKGNYQCWRIISIVYIEQRSVIWIRGLGRDYPWLYLYIHLHGCQCMKGVCHMIIIWMYYIGDLIDNCYHWYRWMSLNNYHWDSLKPKSFHDANFFVSDSIAGWHYDNL